MSYVKNAVVVDLGNGHCIEDRTYESREDFQRFCDKYGYKLVSFVEGCDSYGHS